MPELVPQRAYCENIWHDVGDCSIAAIASIAGRTYEQIAAMFGFVYDPETGKIIAVPWPHKPRDIIRKLTDSGFRVTEFEPSKLPLVRNINAIIHVYIQRKEGPSGGHCLCYSDGLLRDTRYPERQGVPLRGTDIISAYNALVLSLDEPGEITRIDGAWTIDQLCIMDIFTLLWEVGTMDMTLLLDELVMRFENTEIS